MDLLSLGRLTLILSIFFFLKVLSAYYICCLYSDAFRTTIIMYQTLWTLIRLLPLEQSDLGPLCLQLYATEVHYADEKAGNNCSEWWEKG